MSNRPMNWVAKPIAVRTTIIAAHTSIVSKLRYTACTLITIAVTVSTSLSSIIGMAQTLSANTATAKKKPVPK
ncbi:hypothetical protein D3C86_2119600 [compost metagenome]